MTETELQRAIINLCNTLGLLCYHEPDSRLILPGITPGFPDLVIAGQLGIVFAELKSETGQTSAHQDLWLWTLARAAGKGPVYAMVWRPADWPVRIRSVLESIR